MLDADTFDATGRVVVVDDSEATADILVRQLQLEGYNPVAYYDPVEALEALKADPPDLVLMDVNMPRMNGMEVLENLRAYPMTSELPIILVTASGEAADVVRGLDLGANDYITKPPQYEILMARVRTHIKVGQLQRQRRRDLEELRQLDALKDKFLQIAAHDLRNPINNIVLGTELLERAHHKTGEPIPQFDELVSTMRSASNLMKSIVNDFLELQAIRTGSIDLELEAVDLNQLTADVVSQYRAYADEKSVELRLNLEQDLPIVDGDPDRLVQVVANLVSNAIKFSPPGAVVGVRTRLHTDSVLCEVADTGPGIPEDEMDMLFQEFARLSNKPTGDEKSSGVGLSIVQQLVDLHNGQIGCRSEVGRGSLFWFTLPLM